MNKVKLTEVQSNQLEELMKRYSVDVILSHDIFNENHWALNSITTANLARALLLGYEVEPEQKEFGELRE